MGHGIWYLTYFHKETNEDGNVLSSGQKEISLGATNEEDATKEAKSKWRRLANVSFDKGAKIERRDPYVIYKNSLSCL